MKQHNMNDHQCLLKMLTSNDVKQLKCVLGVTLKHGCSVSAIVMHVEQVINGLYTAYGDYSKCKLDIAFLVKSLSGPKLLYALCCSHGLPAYTGSKGSITQWVHVEYMEGSETIRPTFTQWVRGGYFSRVPTKVPTG